MIYSNSFGSIKELVTTLQKFDAIFNPKLVIFLKSGTSDKVLLTISEK